MFKFFLASVFSIIASADISISKPADFEFIDKIYDENIKTVRLFPMNDHPNRELLASAAPLNGEFSLLLQFDHLFADRNNFYAKFIHCNADWSPSRLFALDYLDVYNKFLIEDYEFSFNTRVPYIHYRFVLPRFKVSGSYLLIVYRETDDNVVLTKRFMIYENRVGLINERGNTGIANITRMNQEIQFRLDYGGISLRNPYRNIKVTIRQNQRWDNAIYSHAPTFIDEGSRVIEYRHFAGENQFSGGNQFRFFDLQSLRYFGRNVETVDLNSEIPIAILETDKPRGSESYSEIDDQNGKYRITHPFESEYCQVAFSIESEKLNADVYIAGDFNLWRRSEDFRLEYDEEMKRYYILTLLKQGFYNYQYLIEGENYNTNFLEGDHFQTENEYDISVYYHSFESGADLLIGFFTLSKNPRF